MSIFMKTNKTSFKHVVLVCFTLIPSISFGDGSVEVTSYCDSQSKSSTCETISYEMQKTLPGAHNNFARSINYLDHAITRYNRQNSSAYALTGLNNVNGYLWSLLFLQLNEKDQIEVIKQPQSNRYNKILEKINPSSYKDVMDEIAFYDSLTPQFKKKYMELKPEDRDEAVFLSKDDAKEALVFIKNANKMFSPNAYNTTHFDLILRYIPTSSNYILEYNQ